MQATQILQYTTSVIYTFTYVTSLNLNACVCFDLILMLTNPFKKSEARYFPFLFGSILVGVIMTISQVFPFGDPSYQNRINSAISFIAYLAFVTLGLISIIVSFGVLSRPGVSRELRRVIFQRHFAYITAYTFCNIFTALSDIIFILNNKDFEVE